MRTVTKLTGWLYPERSFHPSISITTQWGGLVRLLDIVNNCISAITMHMVTKLFNVVAYHEEPTTINSHDSLVMWSLWGQVAVWKFYISTFTRLVVTKLGRVLRLGNRFSIQTPKLSPTSCFSSLFYLVAVFWWTGKSCLWISLLLLL